MATLKKARLFISGLGLPLAGGLAILFGGLTAAAASSNDWGWEQKTRVLPFSTHSIDDETLLDTAPPIIITKGKNGTQIDHYRVHKLASITISSTLKYSDKKIAPIAQEQKVGVLHREEVPGASKTVYFGTDYRDDDSMYVGQTKLISKGANGTKHTVYEVYSVHGVEKSRNPIKEVVDTQPTNAVYARGTQTPRVTCIDVTSYDYNWNNDVLCTNPDGSKFYTNYAGGRRYGYNF
jgi:uncharacterized protein YabE (DUF348 family)